MKSRVIIILSLAALSLAAGVSAQEQPKSEEKKALDAVTLTQLKTIMTHLLDMIYVSPEIGTRLARQLTEKFDAGS